MACQFRHKIESWSWLLVVITHWPAIGATETLYSVAQRVQFLHGMGSSYQASKLLFGFPTAASHRFNARNLDHFNGVTGDRLGAAEEILRFRTPVGQFAPFIKRSEWMDIVSWCKRPPGTSRPFLSLRGYCLPTKAPLRFCPTCYQEDLRALGCSTWRMEHQLIETRRCIWHSQYLLQEDVKHARAGDQPNAWRSPADCIALDLVKEIKEADTHFWTKVSRINWILATNPRTDVQRLREIAHRQLAQRDVSSAGGRLSQAAVADWWAKAERPSFLCDKQLADFDDHKWIHQLLLSRRKDHPLRWSILLTVLMSPDELEAALALAPQLQMTLTGRWEVDQPSREDLLKPKVWKMLTSGMSVSSVAKATKLEPSQIRHALRSNPQLKKVRDQMIAESMRLEKRNVISSLMKKDPDLKRVDLMKSHSAVVRWLELHDWPWISKAFASEVTGKFVQRTFKF